MTSGNTRGSGPTRQPLREDSDNSKNSDRVLGTPACKPYTELRVRCECPTGSVTVRRSIEGYKTDGTSP